MIHRTRCRPSGPATRSFFATAIALGTLVTSAAAQAPTPIDREMTFVRGLARELGLVSLAQSELARLEQSYKSSSDQDRILQLRVEVSLFGARIKQNRTEQRADYKKALDQSKELLERSSDTVVQRDARATLAEAAQEFGQFLNEELEIARVDAPETVEELENEAKEVFILGVESCDSVMRTLEPETKDPQKKLEYGLTWMRKGVLMREHGRAVKQDRGHLIDRAIGELEEMVLEVGEETALGLRGLFEIAQCYEVAGKVPTAIDAYRGTIDSIAMTLNSEDTELSGETLAFLFDMMQEVYAHLSELLFEQGQMDAAKDLFQSFHDNLAKFGEKGLDPLDVCHPRHGHLTFLVECRFLAESGDPKKVQQALAMVQKINDKHPSDYVGVKAKAVLSDILEAQKSLVSGKLLFEIAKGEYQNNNHEAAIQGLRRALAAMNADEQQELGLEAYDMLGKCFAATDRYLESVLALQQGLRKFGNKGDGSEADSASDVADRLDRAVTALKSVTKNDANLKPVFDGAEPLVLEFSTAGAGKVHWKNGNKNFGERNWEAAAAAYAQVPLDFLYYELARARMVKAYSGAGDFQKARAGIDAYRQWLETKEAVLDPKRTDKAQVREFAVREMDFTQAFMAYAEAYGDSGLKIEKDTAKYPRAIELLQAFVANHGQSKESSLAQAIDYLGRLHSDLGDLAKANTAYMQLKDLDEGRASRLASVIFAAQLDHAENISKELDAAFATDKPGADVEKLRNDLRQARTQLTGLGIEYMRNSQQPQLGILVHTMNAFERLGDWKKVDEVAQKALQLYGSETDERTKDVIDLTVRPKIGEALLQQRQFQQALDMLLAAEQANPNQYELKRLICKALGGWFYINQSGRGVKEPALGRFKEAYDKYFTEYRTWALRDNQKYTLDWYRFQWESYWFAKQAGEKDSTYKEYAASIFRVTGALDKFAGLKALGQDGMTLFTYFDLNRP
ncbi:MAG: tetratricopeptide repeat protein [Planctomycetota bacterium]